MATIHYRPHHRFAPTAQCEKPPKSGCRNVTPRLANNLYNRSSAVDSLIIQLAPGRQANLGLRLYNRPSAVASPIIRHHPSYFANGAIHRHRRKTAEERFNMLARGWLAYPVTPKQGTGTRTIGMRQRRITPRNPIRTKRQRRAHGASAGTIYMRFGDALLRRPRKRSRLQLTPDRVGGTRTDADASRSAAAERSIAKCRKLGRR